MTTIKTKQLDSLKEAIYKLIMKFDEVDMGNMGEAYDTAEILVDDWVKAECITVID